MCSGSGNSCYPAIKWALQGSHKLEVLGSKICAWIDQISLIRAQINFDVAAGLTALSDNTKSLIIDLIAQFDSEPSFYTNGTSDFNEPSTEAGEAYDFGLTLELNSRLVNALVRTCKFDFFDPPVEVEYRVRLDEYDNIVLNSPPTGTYDPNPIRFNNYKKLLICIADHLRQLKVFVERTARAKKCEVPC